MNEKSQILDGLLVLRAQRGDRQAFEQLVLKWHKKLLYQSFIRTKKWEQSEDIVQDVWQWLIPNIRKLKEAGKFGAWIRTIVDRRSIDWVRKQERVRNRNEQVVIEVVSDEAENGAADVFEIDNNNDDNQMARLEKAMSGLNPDSKMVLMLYYTESNSIETIALILGVPKGTVKSRLYNAREKLKNMIKQKAYEEPK